MRRANALQSAPIRIMRQRLVGKCGEDTTCRKELDRVWRNWGPMEPACG